MATGSSKKRFMNVASMAIALSAPPVVPEEPQLRKQLRNQLAAVVRSINWSYAIFWSISSSRPGALLTWKDGFYNGEIKTRKIANSMELTAEELILQRSEQLLELYESLQSDSCDHRDGRPVAALSPEDLGSTEWYYVVCMTYAFRPGQGLPGTSFASNEHVWLCNAHLANCKMNFPRALLAKSASIQTIVCMPLMGGVLELGTTASVPEDPDLLNRAAACFKELKFPRCTENHPSANLAGKANNAIAIDDLDQNGMETITTEGHEIGGVNRQFSGNLEQITKEVDDFYGLLEELDVQSPQDSGWITEGSSLMETPGASKENDASLSTLGDGSRATSFIAWSRLQSDERTLPVMGEPQKLLKKVVAGKNCSENTARSQESGTKTHVMSERRRREKLNEMFLVLKSLVPTIHKMDKASILAETISYLKELERKVKELESRREPNSPPGETSPMYHGGAITGMRVAARAKRKALELNGDREMEHRWVLSKDGPSNVSVTVMGTEVLLEVQCRWKELLMTRVFDTLKSLDLDVLSVEASTPDCLLGLKIRAQFASSAIPPGMIQEALWRAVASHSSGS